MDESRRKLIIATVIAVGILGLGGLLYDSLTPATISGLIRYPRPARGHDNSVVFAFDDNPLPPAGGVHWDIWQNCGIYDEPIETGNAVHSMEHGAVWITYQPDLSDNEVEKLQDRVRDEGYLLLSPYPNLESPVVLSAWGLQLAVDDVDDGRINLFIDRYRLGSQTPEPGAACDRGIGSPIDRVVETGQGAMESP